MLSFPLTSCDPFLLSSNRSSRYTWCMHLCVHADERCEQKPTNSLSRSFLSLLLSRTHTELWFFSRYSLFSKWFVFQSHVQLPCTQSIRKPKRISLGMASQSTYDVELCSLTLSPPHPYPTVITHKGKYKDLSRSLQEEIRSNKKIKHKAISKHIAMLWIDCTRDPHKTTWKRDEGDDSVEFGVTWKELCVREWVCMCVFLRVCVCVGGLYYIWLELNTHHNANTFF